MRNGLRPVRPGSAPRALRLALEPRMMFDAAAVATAEVATKAAVTAAADGHDSGTSSQALLDAAAAARTAPAGDKDAAPASPLATGNDTDKATTAPVAADAPADGAHQVVIVDTSVADYQTLIAGMDPSIPIILLGEGQRTMHGIAEALSGYSNLDSVFLVTEGGNGGLILGGNHVLTDGALAGVATDLAAIGASMKAGGDFMLLGCSVAADANGQRFVDDFARYLGNDIDVAASSDRTGPAVLGGDWVLEYATGDVSDTVLPFTVSGMEGIDHCLGCTAGTQSASGFATIYHNGTNIGGYTRHGGNPYVLFWNPGQTNTGWDTTNNIYTTSLSAFLARTDVAQCSDNSAPVLDASKSPVITSESNATTAAPSGAVGTLVSALVGNGSGINNVTDSDSSPQLGIALTATDSSRGTWWYSTNNGTSWSQVSTVSTSSSLLLRADASTRLYYQVTDTTYVGTLNSAVTFRAWDQSSGTAGTRVSTTSNGGITAFSTATDTASLTITQGPPTVTDAQVSISGASGTGGAYKIGDTVTATWNNSVSGDNNSGVTGVTMDFSQFGGGAAVVASNLSGTWTATYTITSGAIDATNRNVSVTATNGGGNTTRADTSNATVDNVSPTVTDGRISISGGSGSGGAYKIGDTVTATWNNTAGGDNNSDTISAATMNFSAFGGGTAVTASNSSGTWTATYTIVAGSIDSSNRNVSVTATDNAGNSTTTTDSSNASVDTIAPSVTDGAISISGATGSGGVYRIGDTVTATWNNSASGDNNSDTISGATVNFSAFGGGSAVAMTNSAGIWTATYTLVAGAIDSSSRNVSVTATDNAGNSTTTADSSNASVDNVAPSVTDAHISLSGASGGGNNFVVGDTVTVTWDNSAAGDNNSDTISGPTVDFSAFGGGSAVTMSNSAGIWTATYTLGAGTTLGSNRNVSVSVTDNAGNRTTRADTTNATVANSAPVLDASKSPSLPDELASNTSLPGIGSGTLVSSLVGNGSGIDNVSDANSGALTGLAITATDASHGIWWYTTDNGSNWTVMGTVSTTNALLLAADGSTRVYFQVSDTSYSGTLSSALTFRAWDQSSGTAGSKVNTSTNGGISAFSAATDSVSLTILPPGPAISDANIGISGASGTGGAYKIGDTVTVTWNNSASGDNNSGVTAVTVDFSEFGGGSAVAAVNSGGVWVATFTLTAGAIDASNRNVSISATNSDGTSTTTDSSNASVDNIAPGVGDAAISISGGSGAGGAFVVGDTVTVTWNNTASGDNNSDTISAATVDFSAFGGGSAVAASNSAGIWTATYTLTAGTALGTGRNVAVTVTDNAGNIASATDTSDAAVVNKSPTLSTTTSTPVYTEGGSAVSLFDGTLVTTGESGQSIRALTLTISGLADGNAEILGVDGTSVTLVNGNSVTTSANGYNVAVSLTAGTATVTISRTGDFSASAAQALVNGLTYRNSSADPTAGSGRTVTLTSLQDNGGTADGGVDTTPLNAASIVDISPVNDAPTLPGGTSVSLPATPFGSTGTAVGVASLLSDSGYADVDGHGIAGVALTASSGAGTWQYSADGGTTWSNVGTISATAALLLNGTSEVRYVPDGQTQETATLTFKAWDQTSGTASSNATRQTANTSGGSSAFSSDTATASIATQGALMTAGGSSGYTEDGAANAIDPGLTVTDSATSILQGATVSIGSVAAGDVLGFTSQNGISGSYDSVTGVLTLSGNASVASYQTALRSVTFSSTSQDPTIGGTRPSRTISWSVDDGIQASASVSSTVTLTAVNDAPTLTTTAGSPTFTEGGSAVSLFGDTAISTTETGQNIHALTLSVSGVADGAAERLSIDGTSVALSDGNSVTTAANGYSVAVTLASGTATVTITRPGDFSASAAQSLVDGLTYSNASSDPTVGSGRSIALVQIQDDGGTANGGADTATPGSSTATVTIAAVNDAPSLSASANAPTFIEKGDAVSLFSGTSISAGEGGQSIRALTLSIGGLADGSAEVLSVDGSAIMLVDGVTTTGNGYSVAVSLVSGTANVTITRPGDFSTAAAQTLVDGLAYRNGSDAPTPGAGRSITLTSIQDTGGGAGSGVDTTTLSITASVALSPVNDAPVLNLPGAQSFTSTEAHTITGISVTDSDAGTGLATMTLSAGTGSLTVVASGAVSVSGNGTGSIILSGNLVDLNATLATLTYATTESGRDTLSLFVDDNGNTGDGGSKTASGSIDINTRSGPVALPLYLIDRPVSTLPDSAPPASISATTLVITPAVFDLDQTSSNLLTPAVGTGEAGISGTADAGLADDYVIAQALSPRPSWSTASTQRSAAPVDLSPVNNAQNDFDTAAPDDAAADRTPPSRVTETVNQSAIAGQAMVFTLPQGTFANGVSLEARQANGQPLPSWLRFDPDSATFSGRPPAGAAGYIVINVSVRQGDAPASVIRINLSISRDNRTDATPGNVGSDPSQASNDSTIPMPNLQHSGQLGDAGRPHYTEPLAGKPSLTAQLRAASAFGIANYGAPLPQPTPPEAL